MNYTILIVDDEPDVTLYLQKRLDSLGYNVITASDGQEGLQKAFQAKPELILLDIMMPKKDGLATLKELRAAEATRNIPVIMLTARGESNSIFTFQELGALDYIIKPFEFEELLKYIKKYTL